MTRPASPRRRALAIVMVVPTAFFANRAALFAAQDTPLGITHDSVSCIVAGRHPKLDACVTPADRVGRAQIHFRANEAGPWYAVDLAPAQPCPTAILPRPLPTTRSVQYFVNVIDRGFAESRRPDAAPGAPYRVRVVKDEAGCDEMRRAAAWVAQTATPAVITVVRDSSGRVLGPGASGGVTPTLEGFSREGVILSDAPSGPEPGDSPESVSGESESGGSGGGGGGGALLLVGVAIAGGAAALALSGGSDDDPDDPDRGLTGRWSGPAMLLNVGQPGAGFSQTCNGEITLDAQQSGQSLTGTLGLGTATCATTTPNGTTTSTAPGLSTPITGTVNGANVTMAVPLSQPGCPPYQFTGTVSGDTLTGVFRQQCQTLTSTINWTGRR